MHGWISVEQLFTQEPFAERHSQTPQVCAQPLSYNCCQVMAVLLLDIQGPVDYTQVDKKLKDQARIVHWSPAGTTKHKTKAPGKIAVLMSKLFTTTTGD